MSLTLEQKRKISRSKRKLTTEQFDEIRALLQQGTMSQVTIARKYAVSRPFVSAIKHGYRYPEEGEEQGAL